MSTFASGSGSGSASARDADAGGSVLEISKALEAACHVSASQADLVARADFIGGSGGGGGGSAGEEEEEVEVFSTPPLTQQDLHSQGNSQLGQAKEGEDGIAMSMPFTQTQSSSPSPASSSSSSPPSGNRKRKPRKPRICTRKVPAGAKVTKIRTPTPPPAPAPAPTPSPSPGGELDPLVRMVLMIPSAPLPPPEHQDILELARSRGIF